MNISSCIKKILCIKGKKTKKTIENLGIQHLGPNSKIDRKRIKYIRVLKLAIESKDIKNIGLTGEHSSGKSSVINMLKSLSFYKKSVISISLADLNKEEIEKGEGSNSSNHYQDNNIKKLEKKILQQMLYSVSNSKIPESRFKKVENISWMYKVGSFLVLLLLSLLILKAKYKYSPIVAFLNLFKLMSIVGIRVDIIIDIFGYLAFFVFIYYICTYLKKIDIRNITLKNGTFEVNVKNKEEDIFNKYLDDIIYFFCSTKKKIVIFEDLDRFEDSRKLFLKIRELNFLINNSELMGDNKVTFIYALKDSVFIDEKNKMKFFDLIIPILPILHSSNSETELLRKNNQLDELKIKKIEEKFLYTLSLYIDDMRFVHNIFNEYIIYYRQLNVKKLGLFPEKIMAMILYKNYFPEDFSNLLNNKGNLYNIITAKEKKLAELDKKMSSFTREDLSEAEELERERENIQYLTLSDYLSEYQIEIDNFNDIIVYFIKERYIDIDLYLYLSCYNSLRINPSDKVFLLSIKNRKALSVNFKIYNFNEILKGLTVQEFKRKEIFNNYLIEYILLNKDRYKEEIESFLSQVENKENIKKASDFMLKFVVTNYNNGEKDNSILIPIVYKIIYNYKNIKKMSEDEKKIWIYLIVKYYKKDVINEEEFHFIKEFLKDSENEFLELYREKSEYKLEDNEFFKFIDELNLKIKDIELFLNTIIFDLLYDKNLYELTSENIQKIVNKKNNEANLKINIDYIEFIDKNLNRLIEYIDNNVEIYIKELKKSNPKIISKEWIISLLSKNIKRSIKNKFISILLEEEYRELINEKDWNIILEENLVLENEKIMIYKILSKNYFEKIRDIDLLNKIKGYIEKNKEKNSFGSVDKFRGEIQKLYKLNEMKNVMEQARKTQRFYNLSEIESIESLTKRARKIQGAYNSRKIKRLAEKIKEIQEFNDNSNEKKNSFKKASNDIIEAEVID